MYKLTIVTLGVLFTMSCTQQKKSITWISSTENSVWEEAIIESVSAKEELDVIEIKVDQQQQQIDGFGACFNELGWEALALLTKEERDQILSDFFDPESGCKFNICRMPVGANDYAVDWYSHNETPDDFEMKNFSIDRDKTRLVPYIKMAQAIRPDLQIWGSPWCPPSWMKTNNHYACRPDVVNDLPAEGEGEEMVTQFIMQPDYLNAYALYFEKYIKAYAAEGIDIYAVHVQNEMNSCQNFPSCIWRPEDLGTFISDYLGPRFKEQNMDTEIWYGTVERPHIERVDPILQGAAAEFITGIGFQWAGKEAIPKVQAKYPEYKLMQTESECGDGSNDWAAAEYTFGLMKHYLNHGANTYLYWNMILNETGKSQWGWKQNSLISVDSETKKFVYNPEFYLMKHFSAFVKAGSYKIETNNENYLAFKNAESIIVVTYHEGEAGMKNLKIGDDTYTIPLKAKSINTFEIKL